MPLRLPDFDALRCYLWLAYCEDITVYTSFSSLRMAQVLIRTGARKTLAVYMVCASWVYGVHGIRYLLRTLGHHIPVGGIHGTKETNIVTLDLDISAFGFRL